MLLECDKKEVYDGNWELIEKVQRGEREVYGQLFQKYYAQIYAICLAMLGNPHDAEDLAQDVWVLAYQRLDQLRDAEKFFPWLKNITRNRSKNRVQRAGPKLVPLDLASSHTAPDAPDERLLRQELIDSIMEAVKALPARDGEVVQARIDGLSHTEISERFGISVQASMNRLSRARHRLADHMKGLLSVIFGLPRILSFRKLISGGILAMKIGTTAKVTIGVVGILVVGFIGLQLGTRLIGTHPPETDISPSETGISQRPSSRTKTSQKAVQRVDSQPSVGEQNVEDGEDILDSLDADTVETQSTSANSAQKVLPEASQDQSKMEYHESYDTFISVTKEIKQTKAKMDSIEEEMDRMYGEWKRRVRDPKNPTAEEKAELGEEVTPLRVEHAELSSDLNSLADELVSEIEAVASGAVQTESEDTPRGTLNSVSIDYEHIQSELGSLPEEDEANLAEFFAGFEIKSHPSSGWSSVNISR